MAGEIKHLGIHAVRGSLRKPEVSGLTRQELRDKIDADRAAGMQWKEIARKYGYTVGGIKAVRYTERITVATATID